MHDCDDNDCAGLDSIINTEGEAMNEGAPCVSVNDGIYQWCFGNRGEGRKNLVKKLMTQPQPLLFIPERRIRQL